MKNPYIFRRLFNCLLLLAVSDQLWSGMFALPMILCFAILCSGLITFCADVVANWVKEMLEGGES